MVGLNLDSLLATFNARWEERERAHLRSMYGCLSLCSLSAAFGAYTSLLTEFSGLSIVGLLGSYFALKNTVDARGQNRKERLIFLLVFAFCIGLIVGSIVESAVSTSPHLIALIFHIAWVTLACFSGIVYLTSQGQVVLAAGPVVSLAALVADFRLAKIFVGANFLYQYYPYMVFFGVCGILLFGTAALMEKRNHWKNSDFVAHSLDIMLDVGDVCRHASIALLQKNFLKKYV